MTLEERVNELSKSLHEFCKGEMDKIKEEHPVVVLHLATISLVAANILTLRDFTNLTYEQIVDDFIIQLNEIKEKVNEH